MLKNFFQNKFLKWTVFILLGFTILLSLITFFMLGSNGLFKRIDVEENINGPYILVYEKNVGDYKNTAEIQNKLFQDVMKYGVQVTKGFGIYYDNPRETPVTSLRSIAGVVIDYIDNEKLISNIRANFNTLEIPSTVCLTTYFPLKNNLSIVLGIMKVYPKMNKVVEEKGYKKLRLWRFMTD
jgi:hypothetical protein